jgi:pSer/pThr/pTyr-binding forkhead associated (FHA) protein
MEPVVLPAARLRYLALDIPLYAGQTLHIGRAPENDVVISDLKVSRQHALLTWNGTGFTLLDRGSVNGTYVNGERLTTASRPLRDADCITLGEQTLRYELVRVELSPPAAPVATNPITRPPSGRPRLRVESGPDQGREYILWGEMITIGRDSREATWEIRLSDRSISRPHLRLVLEDGCFTVEDLESGSGTLLNDAPLSARALLADGDAISLGETRLVFYAR